VLNKEIKICKIFTFNEEDFLLFNLEFSSSGVEVIASSVNQEFKDDGIPTLIVGWSNVKQIFEGHRISKRKISENIFWVYSSIEDKKNTIEDTRKFVKSILLNWLPNTYIPYDYILDGRLSIFLDKHLTNIFLVKQCIYLIQRIPKKLLELI